MFFSGEGFQPIASDGRVMLKLLNATNFDIAWKKK